MSCLLLFGGRGSTASVRCSSLQGGGRWRVYLAEHKCKEGDWAQGWEAGCHVNRVAQNREGRVPIWCLS